MGRSGHPSFELLSAYHDGEATPVETAQAMAHLDRCSACRKTLAGFDLLQMAVQSTPAVSCAGIRQLLGAELDGETRADETAIATAHLAACADCRSLRSSWQRLDVAIQALPGGVPSPAADARIRGAAHRGTGWRLPTGPVLRGGMLGRVSVAVVAFIVAFVASLPQGATVVPPIAAQADRPLVAGVQQVLNARTNTLYVLEPATGLVLARNASTNVDIAQIAVGGRPTALALNEAANVVYVLDARAKTYTTISGDTNTITATARVPLDGDVTSIQVNQTTGQLVIAAAAPSAAPSATVGQLAIIDPASQSLTTRSVDVAATQVVLDAPGNRIFLLGPNGTSVVDATTYASVASLPPAVAVAASAIGDADAILSLDGGKAKLSFFGVSGSATFDGTPVNAVSLPDGSFALLIDRGGSTRIELVDRRGGSLGSLDVTGTARALTFDPDSKHFLGANGQVVATISGTSIALASPPPASAPAASAPPQSATPSPSAPASVAPSAPPSSPAAAKPTAAPSAPPSGPVPGATLGAVGIYRFGLPDGVVATSVAGSGDRLWFVDQKGVLTALDTTTGRVSPAHLLQPDASIARLVVSPTAVFALDAQHATLYDYDTRTGRLSSVAVPFGRSINAMEVAPNGRLWLGAGGFNGLLSFDPLSGRFDLVTLGQAVSVAALTTDLAGQIWFLNGASGELDRYDPASARLSTLELPAGDAYVALRADTRGAIWVGSGSGAVYRIAGGAPVLVATAGVPIVSFALAPDGTMDLLAAGGQFTLAGPATGALRTAPAGARSFAADASGRLWLADRELPLFYIVERQ